MVVAAYKVLKILTSHGIIFTSFETRLKISKSNKGKHLGNSTYLALDMCQFYRNYYT